jgi:hypothetical protein
MSNTMKKYVSVVRREFDGEPLFVFLHEVSVSFPDFQVKTELLANALEDDFDVVDDWM